MHHPSDGSTSQQRYGLVLVEDPGSLVAEHQPWRPPTSNRAAPDPRAPAERFAVAGFALTYLVSIGWLALRAVRWLIDV
jgi:hypothetical protein